MLGHVEDRVEYRELENDLIDRQSNLDLML